MPKKIKGGERGFLLIEVLAAVIFLAMISLTAAKSFWNCRVQAEAAGERMEADWKNADEFFNRLVLGKMNEAED